MKKTHIAAIACFGVAFLLYAVAASSAAGGGFAFLGFIFEIMAWTRLFGSKNDESRSPPS